MRVSTTVGIVLFVSLFFLIPNVLADVVLDCDDSDATRTSDCNRIVGWHQVSPSAEYSSNQNFIFEHNYSGRFDIVKVNNTQASKKFAYQSDVVRIPQTNMYTASLELNCLSGGRVELHLIDGNGNSIASALGQGEGWHSLTLRKELVVGDPYSVRIESPVAGGVCRLDRAEFVQGLVAVDISGGGRNASCCASAYCYNGTSCVLGQKIFNSLAPRSSYYGEFGIDTAGPDLYICQQNENNVSGWVYGYYKEQWYNQSRGYCPTNNQCWLSDTRGCVDPETFSDDFFCESKDDAAGWSSRTKYVGLQLLTLLGGSAANYTLYCDDFSHTLNNVEYRVGQNPASSYFGECAISDGGLLCNDGQTFVNNFCVLEYPAGDGEVRTILGTSLNKPIDKDPFRFFEVFDADSDTADTYLSRLRYTGCSYDERDSYTRCAVGNDRLWYNNKTMMLIYAKEGASVGALATDDGPIVRPLRALAEFLRQTIRPRSASSTSSGVTTEVDYEFISKTKLFSRLYVRQTPTKTIRGAIERFGGDDEYLAINYSGFRTDICGVVRDYNTVSGQNDLPSGGLNCNNSFSSTIVSGKDPEVMLHWDDLTAKLRVS